MMTEIKWLDGKYVDKQKLDDKAGELKPWRRRKADPNGTKQAFCRRQMGAAATFCRLPDGAGERKESRGIIRAGGKGQGKILTRIIQNEYFV